MSETNGQVKTSRTILDYAKWYAKQGWHVVPTHLQTKCHIGNWTSAATTDETQLEDWFNGEWSDAGLALHCGKSNLVVIDIEKDGELDFLDLVSEHNLELPPTFTQHSGGGGRHLFYSCDRPNLKTMTKIFGKQVDILCGVHCVCMTPSLHASGNRYYFDPDSPKFLAELPKKCVDLFFGAKQRKTPQASKQIESSYVDWKTESIGGIASGTKIQAGERNSTLASIAGAVRKKGATSESILALLRVENETRCDPPLHDNEVARIAESIGSYEPEPIVAKGPKIEFVAPSSTWTRLCAADDKEEPVTWLIEGFIPANALTLQVGFPKNGKSLACNYYTSCLTTGTPFFAGDAPAVGEVLYFNIEDDIKTIWRPRLRLAGADLSKVNRIKQRVNLKKDLDQFRRDLEAHPQTKLVIVDSLAASLGGVDFKDYGAVYDILFPLNEIAGTYGITIIANHHINKGTGKTAVERIMGSMAFSGACRAAYFFSKDAQDQMKYYMAKVTASGLGDVPTVAASIVVHKEPIPDKPAKLNEIVTAVYSGAIADLSADDLLQTDPGFVKGKQEKKSSNQMEADTKVLKALQNAGGKMDSDALWKQVKAEGVSWDVYVNAKKNIGALSDQVTKNKWWAYLPNLWSWSKTCKTWTQLAVQEETNKNNLLATDW